MISTGEIIMKKFEKFSVHHPIIFGFILIMLFTLLSTLTWPITRIYPHPEEYEVGNAISKLMIAACFMLLLWGFGWLKPAGFSSFGRKQVWFLVIVLIIYKAILGVYAFTGSLQFSLPSASFTLAVILYTFATSLLEETMYRGLLLTAMAKAWGRTRRGLFAAAILSGLFWASLHLFNLLVRPFPLVMMQVLEMSLVGFLYAAFVLAGRSIWPAVIIHWATNAAVSLRVVQIPNFSETNTAWGISFLITVPLIAVGIYLLCKTKLPTQARNEETLGNVTLTYQTALEERHGS